MRGRAAHKSSFSRMALLVFVAIAASAAPVAMGVVTPTAGGAQSAAAAQNSTEATTAFEVTSMRLFDPNTGSGGPGLFSCGFTPKVEGTRFAIIASPYGLIWTAYAKPPNSDCRLADLLLTGGPEWVKSDLYEIEGTLAKGQSTYTPDFANRVQIMLQTLLAD